jgi:acyl carrier protein
LINHHEKARDSEGLICSFDADLQADSLDCVELLMAIEVDYALKVPDGEANEIRTVGDLISYLERRLSKS